MTTADGKPAELSTPDEQAAEPSARRVVQLPERVANQIAAGEVVARPASVVKELVENALDAGARNVRVEIEGGGVVRAQVVDDGRGMDRQDALLAFRRHATSKLRVVDDLKAIKTLGFRGEALPSIASVTRFLLRTRRPQDEAGTELRIEGGAPAQLADCGCAPGTSAEARDLFYNVPARRKFLRALATESAHVTEAVRAAALAHHEVSFTLIRDGRRARRWLRAESREARVRDVFRDYPLLSCEGRRGPAVIEAHLSQPQRARSGAGGLALYVNGRPVQDRGLARAVANAYGEALERGRYPVGAVFIELAPDLVDVNVHPQKAQVRFAHARALSDALYSIIAPAIASSLGVARSTALPPSPAAAQKPSAPYPLDASSGDWQWSTASPSPRLSSDASQPSAAAPPLPQSTLQLLGCVDDGAFLLWQHGSKLAVLDRTLMQREMLTAALQRELKTNSRLVSQQLLFPTRCEASDACRKQLEAASGRLQRLGFDVRKIGPRTLTIHAVPRLVATASSQLLLEATLAALADSAKCDASDLEPALQALSRLGPAKEELSEQRAIALITAWDQLQKKPLAERRAVLALINIEELRRKAAARD